MREFIDYVEAGRALVSTVEANYWKLGDLAAEFEVTAGRPQEGDEAPTLGDLANGWGVARASVSEWRSNARFYPPRFRTFDDLSYSHYTLARRAGDDIEDALELLTIASAQAFSISGFKRFLSGVLAEGPARVDELPPRWQALVPTGVRRVWLRVETAREEEG